MKRSPSLDNDTPKKRRKSRGPGTPSPLSRHRPSKSPSTHEAKAASALFQKAVDKRKMECSSETPAAEEGKKLEPANSVLGTPPASSSQENLSSVVHKLPPSSGSADMEMSDGDAAEVAPNEKPTSDATSDKMEETALEITGKEDSQRVAEPVSKDKADEESSPALITNVQDMPASTPEPTAKPDNVDIAEIKLVRTTPRQRTGATADDAMELDTSPSEQLKQEFQHSQQADEGDAAALAKPTSVVSSDWLIEKLHGLAAETLDADRDAVIQELHDMEAAIAQLPRAEMHHPAAAAAISSGSGPEQRLLMVETLIAPQLAKMPAYTWRGYKSKLLRLCASPAIHNMDYRQRLEKVKEIIYMPEEMELLHRGDKKRIECAVRVCAAVTEIMGREDETVPEEMAAWVGAQLKDMAWKAKVTSVWRKYWPAENGMVVD